MFKKGVHKSGVTCEHESWVRIHSQKGILWRCQNLKNRGCEVELTPAEWHRFHDESIGKRAADGVQKALKEFSNVFKRLKNE